MAKDKTKPRTDLTARREAALKLQRATKRKRRWGIARNILIALVIIGLAATGIVITVLHVRVGEKTMEMNGDPTATQITPPNATSDGLAILANPGVTLTADALTVDMYVDYQDTNSIQAMQYFGQALTSMATSGAIALNYHLLYLSDTTNKNESAGRAAVAAACADTVGAFAAFNQTLFDNGSYYAGVGNGFTDVQMTSGFPSQSSITGDDLTTYQQCYADRATSGFVTTMNSKNQTTPTADTTNFPNGVTYTPVMLANGVAIDMSSIMSQYGTDQPIDATTLLQALISATTQTTS